MKYPPIVIGKSYQYNSSGTKVYVTDPTKLPNPESLDYPLVVGEMSQGDMFVPLETNSEWPKDLRFQVRVFRILTKNGMNGWAFMRPNDVLEAEG